MQIYYSPKEQGFFHEGFQDSIPADAVEISQEQYEELLDAASLSKKISYKGGEFKVEDFKSIVTEESEKLWRDAELALADIEVNKAEDEDNAERVKAFRAYRVSLRNYPTTKGFPSVKARPEKPTV